MSRKSERNNSKTYLIGNKVSEAIEDEYAEEPHREIVAPLFVRHEVLVP